MEQALDIWTSCIGEPELIVSLTGKIKTKRLPIGHRETKTAKVRKYLTQGPFQVYLKICHFAIMNAFHCDHQHRDEAALPH